MGRMPQRNWAKIDLCALLKTVYVLYTVVHMAPTWPREQLVAAVNFSSNAHVLGAFSQFALSFLPVKTHIFLLLQ